MVGVGEERGFQNEDLVADEGQEYANGHETGGMVSIPGFRTSGFLGVGLVGTIGSTTGCGGIAATWAVGMTGVVVGFRVVEVMGISIAVVVFLLLRTHSNGLNAFVAVFTLSFPLPVEDSDDVGLWFGT